MTASIISPKSITVSTVQRKSPEQSLPSRNIQKGLIEVKAHRRIEEQQAYDMWLENLNNTITSTVAMVLYVVIQRGWHRDKVIKLFDDIVATLSTPIKVFGKEVDDLYIQDYISKKYPEIDFSRIKVTPASKDENRRRNKQRDRQHI